VTDTALRDRPTREEIALLPVFPGLPLDRIQVLKTAEQIDAAARAIEQERFVGFDTESRPTFAKDALRTGPHVVQFALRNCAFIVQVTSEPPIEFLKSVIESQEIVKVGFGLRSDEGLLHRKLGIRLGATVELSQMLRSLRYRQMLGVKAAVAIVLGQKLQKSKAVTTSNWAIPKLSPKQLLYAANDAFAALAVFHAMGSPYVPMVRSEPGNSGQKSPV
jgi:ribonuclease D